MKVVTLACEPEGNEGESDRSEHRFQRLKADPGQFRRLKTDEPGPGCHRHQGPVSPAPQLDPRGEQHPPSEQRAQEDTRDSPIDEGGAAQGGAIRPEQSPVRSDDQEQTPGDRGQTGDRFQAHGPVPPTVRMGARLPL